MLKYTEIKSLTALKNIQVSGDDLCQIPLFHGTTRYALSIDHEERERFRGACTQVIKFARTIKARGQIPCHELEEYCRTKNPLFLGTVVNTYGSSQYQYGDLYLTSSYTTAIVFAHNAGGELGTSAYSQCKGFHDWGIALDADTEIAARLVVEEYQKYCNSEKIILLFYGVNFHDLLHEGGTPFMIPLNDEEDVVFMREEIEDLYESCKDSDDMIARTNFRLKNLNAYSAYALREKDFRIGFSEFTNIQDMDGAMRAFGIKM